MPSPTITPAPLLVPLLALDRQHHTLGPALSQAVNDVLTSGHFILGPQVQAFENALAQRVGVPFALGVANGSDALYLALKALGIGAGDEVITTSLSYIATSESIQRCGATPVFADVVDDGTFLIDLTHAERLITPRTKALLPVHLYGQAVNMGACMVLAKAHGLAVVEDCAQAIDAAWQGQAVGSFGDVGCFSFFPTKNLGAAGDAGAVCCKDEALYQKLKQLRVHGQSSQYNHSSEGINSRLDEMQAAVLNVKLPHLQSWSEARRAIAKRYQAGLVGLEGLALPVVHPQANSVFHQFTVAVQPNAPLRRQALMEALEAQGVATRIYYPIALHLQGMHAHLGYQAGALPTAEALAEQVLSLPMYPELTEAEQDYVIAAIRQAWGA